MEIYCDFPEPEKGDFNNSPNDHVVQTSQDMRSELSHNGVAISKMERDVKEDKKLTAIQTLGRG
jgi:hypothetical protein